MSIDVRKIGESGLEIDVRDRLDDVDDDEVLQKAGQRIADTGYLDLLVRVSGFRGWSARSLWDALGLDRDQLDRVRRLALVGDEAAAKWLGVMSESFVEADVRFFAVNDVDEAREWVRSGEVR